MQDQLVGLLIPLFALTFAAIFGVVWRWGQAGRHVLYFSASFLALAAGFLVFHFAPNPDSTLAAFASHALYGLAMVFLVAGITRRAEVHVPIGLIAIVQALAALIVALTGPEDVTARVFAMNNAYGICFGVLALALYQAKPRDNIDRVIRFIIAVLTVQNFVRPILVLIMEGELSSADFRASYHYAIVAFLIAILSLLLALSLMYAVAGDQMRAVRKAAVRDTLSGLAMRGEFEERAQDRIEASAAQGETLSIILADIDHFKRVNDAFGHQAGDAAIAGFGRLIADTIRAGDLAGRVGGEEFCIVANGCTEEEAIVLAQRLRRTFASMAHDGLAPDLRLTASFGVAQLRHGEGYRDLFARADTQLYAAKSAGRDRVMPGDEPDTVVSMTERRQPAG